MILELDLVWYLWGHKLRDHHYILKPKVLLLKENKKVGEEGNFFEETMARDKKGTSYDGKKLIKIMEPIFEDMENNIMKGF